MLDPWAVRLIALGTSLVSVPVLLVLTYRTWHARHPAVLPDWRNGLGLAALSLLAMEWLWFALGLADTSLTPRLGATYLDLTILAVICTYLASAFAGAWKGGSRLEALAAGILMSVGWHFFGYA